jgi:transposase
MPRKLRVRELTSEEAETIERLARSRTAATREVERAQIVWRAGQGESIQQIAQELRRNEATVRQWIKRFNAHGLQGLNDEARAGRPATYSAEEVSEVIGLSLTDPQSLGLPFASWTLDRLEAYLNEVKGIGMKRSRIDEVLQAEGLRWRPQETWFGERVDPDFARKRG